MVVSINPYEVFAQGNVHYLKGEKKISNNCVPWKVNNEVLEN